MGFWEIICIIIAIRHGILDGFLWWIGGYAFAFIMSLGVLSIISLFSIFIS